MARSGSDLLFFYPQQGRLLKTINDSLCHYGIPRIDLYYDPLRDLFSSEIAAQSLFAIIEHGDRAGLVGVVIYTLSDFGELTILQVAVDPYFASSGLCYGSMPVVRFLSMSRGWLDKLTGFSAFASTTPEEDKIAEST